MNLYYVPEINADRLILPDEEARHCVQVLRLKEGDLLYLTNGTGILAQAQIVGTYKREVEVQIVERQQKPRDRSYALHMVIAPTKNIDRFEWFLEKVTEIGVDTITPVITEHSERKDIRPDRLEKVLIAAMKQSLKWYKPVLNPLCRLDDFLAEPLHVPMAIAYCGTAERQLLKSYYQVGSDIVLLIGPEGDFSPNEVEKAKASGAAVISLGESRLRTETAGVVACHTIHLLNQ